MVTRHFLTLVNLGADTLARLIDRSVTIAATEGAPTTSLRGSVVGVYFPKPSTRTRTSFTVGALRLGADVITYGPNDLQIVTGETNKDTARVLSSYLDVLVIRTNDAMEYMYEFANQHRMPVINAMSASEHPTQAIADMSTLKEAFGGLAGVHLLYIGEGNNSAAALAFAVAQIPRMRLSLVTPEGYGLPQKILRQACCLAAQHGSRVEQSHAVNDLPKNVDAVYATRWQTMGVPKKDPDWRQKFRPYSVTSSLMERVSKPAGRTVFLHDLPAVRGDDVEDDVLDGQQSLAWRQANHKLFSAMAILEWCGRGLDA